MIRHNSKTIAIALLLLLPALLFGGVRATGSSLISTMPIHRFLQLDGSTQYAYIADNDILDVGEEDFGYSVWFKTSSNVGYPNLLNKHLSVTPGYVFYIDLTTGLLHTILYDALGNNPGLYYGVSVSDGLWHHAVNIIDRSGYCYCFTDGVYITRFAVTSLSGSISNTSELRVGSNAFNGKMDDVRFYKFGVNGLYVNGTIGTDGEIRVGTSTGDLIWSDAAPTNSLARKLYTEGFDTLTGMGFPSIDNANRTEKVTNGDNEAGLANIGGAPTALRGTVSQSNDYAYAGTYSMKFLDNNTLPAEYRWIAYSSPEGVLVSGKQYQLSCYVYIPAANTNLNLVYVSYNNGTTTYNSSNITTKGSWQLCTCTFIASSSTSSALLISAGSITPNNEAFYVDNVSIKQIGEVARWKLDTDLLDTNINGLNLTGVGSPTYGKAGLRAQ